MFRDTREAKKRGGAVKNDTCVVFGGSAEAFKNESTFVFERFSWGDGGGKNALTCVFERSSWCAGGGKNASTCVFDGSRNEGGCFMTRERLKKGAERTE